MNRRRLLRMSLVGMPIVSGCLGSDGSQDQTTTGTNTCSEQYIVPDIQIENQTGSEKIVEVGIYGISSDTEEIVFENSYTASSNDLVEESDRIFKINVDNFDRYRAEISSGGIEESKDITAVAEEPSLYSVRIIIDSSGLIVRNHHVDPGENYNPNCY